MGPLGHTLDLFTDAREVILFDQGLWCIAIKRKFMQAGVVVSAFEDGKGGAALHERLQGVGKPGQVALHQLALQRNRRGGDHHGAAGALGVQKRGHQIRQGLTGAGASLHRQVTLRIKRTGHRLRHGQLALTGSAADGLYRRGKQVLGGLAQRLVARLLA